MFKVDIHTHILPPEIPDFKKQFGYGGFIRTQMTDDCCANMVGDDGTFFRKIESNCWDHSERLKDCEKAHVDVQVLSTVPVMFSYWAKPKDGLFVSRVLNDHIASVVEEHPKKFIGLGTVPMQDPDLAIQELERCLKIGLRGVQIGSHIENWNLDAPELFPFFQAAEKLGAAIFVHPWDMVGKEKMPKYFLPWLIGMPTETTLAICSMLFGGVFERLPNLRVAFAHGGGSFVGTLGRIQKGYECRPDLYNSDYSLSPRDVVGKFYVDALVHDPTSLKWLVEVIGAEKIALGTDYPFPLGEAHPGKMIEDSSFTDNVKARLLSGTAFEWLGQSVEDFR